MSGVTLANGEGEASMESNVVTHSPCTLELPVACFVIEFHGGVS